MKVFPGTLLLVLHLLVIASVARADDEVVTDFGDNGGPNQLRAKLQALEDSGGGTLTFSGDPATIVLAQGVLPSIIADTTVDGAGNITISGNNASRVFFVSAGATLTLNNLTVTNGYNNAEDGGAIRNDGRLVINHCHFTKNRADGWSGGAIVSYGPLTITDSEFANNTAANGGALFPRYGPAVTTISGSSFHDNSTDNTQNAGGGAIFVFNGAPVTISDSDFSANTAFNGGAIHSSFANNTVTLRRTNLRGNKVTNRGGGIYNNSATVNLTDVTLSGNAALGSQAFQVLGLAGGLYNESGTATLINVTLAGNTGSNGGGMFNVNAQATLTNVTFSSNVAYVGAGLLNQAATAALTNVTFYGNKATGSRNGTNSGGGGIYNATFMGTPHLTLKNVVLQNNTEPNNAPGNCAFPQNAPPDSSEFSLSSDGTCGFGAGRDNVDPQLRVLADYGGFTQTHAPEPTSPVIDAGTGNGAPSTDQRGVKRPQGKAVDVGAVELENNQLPGCKDVNTVVSNNNDSGSGSLRDVLGNACAGNTITFARNVTGAINLTSGQLSINVNVTIHGPGANVLKVQRSASAGNFRVFNVGSGEVSANISGLKIANGNIGGADFGGGISNSGKLTLTGVTVSDNSASFLGGGIYNDFGAVLTIDSSTISGNIAGYVGGISNNGTLNVINSTISGNQATTGNGGGIAGGTVVLTNSTIAANSANDSGGGILQSGQNNGSVTCRNTIIALNTAAHGPDFNGPLTSHGFNVIGDASGATITPAQASDQIGVTADQLKLGPLDDNGGPTFTQALLSGSVAIDKGNSSGSTVDQRGLTRPVDLPGTSNVTGGDGADIGAFEFQGSTPGSARLANISTRVSVETGENALIGGFIVTGTQAKKVLLRGIGPSLPVSGALANPFLELHSGSGTVIAMNDDWKETQKAQIEATTIPPGNDLEAALVATLPANTSHYTAVMREVNNGSGVGLVEVYDLDSSVDSKLANISTRGLVKTGDNVMIGGFIVLNGNQKVIVRAIGPSLTIGGKLADPFLELRNKEGTLLQSNDNWKSDQEAEIRATTIPPGNDLESAIVRTLTPGNYTAIVHGVNNTSGVALVEVYALQ